MKNKEIVKSIVVLVVICLLTSAALAIEAALPSGVVSAYAALDAAGTPTSYLFTVEGKGFGGTIQVLCVIGMDGRIRTCRTMDVSSETTTLGGQTANESYTGQYAGQDASLSGVSAISGATITSTAYRGKLLPTTMQAAPVKKYNANARNATILYLFCFFNIDS